MTTTTTMMVSRLAILASSFVFLATSVQQAESWTCRNTRTYELCEKLCCGGAAGMVCQESCVDVPCSEDEECGHGCCSKGRCRAEKAECDDSLMVVVIVFVVIIAVVILVAAVACFLVRRRRRLRREQPVAIVNTVLLPRNTLGPGRQEDAMPLVSEGEQDHDEREGPVNEVGDDQLYDPPPAYTV